MKSIKIYVYSMICLLAVVLVISCTKSFNEKTAQQKDFNNSSLAQVFIATVNATKNYVYVDGKPVTGAELASGSVFPLSGYAFNVPAGLHSFTIRNTTTTSTQVPLVFAENMEVGKKYTIFTYDTITSPKQITVETTIETPADNVTSRLRFANFIYAPFALPAVDVYSFVKGANVFTNVPVTGVTDYISYPSLTTDTLYFRETGTMNELLKLPISTGLTGKRSYTVVYRGSHRGTRVGTIFGN